MEINKTGLHNIYRYIYQYLTVRTFSCHLIQLTVFVILLLHRNMYVKVLPRKLMKMFEKNVKAIAILSSHCIVSLANLLITIPENAKDVNFQ